jgi:hypothetical protein
LTCSAVPLIHATYGAAAAPIDADAGPSHGPRVNPDNTDRYEAAAELNSAPNPSQAAAAAHIGTDPAPAYILPELISGGNAAKSISLANHLIGHDRLGGMRGRGHIDSGLKSTGTRWMPKARLALMAAAWRVF